MLFHCLEGQTNRRNGQFVGTLALAFSSVHFCGQIDSTGRARQSGSTAPGTTPTKCCFQSANKASTPTSRRSNLGAFQSAFQRQTHTLKLLGGGAALPASFTSHQEEGGVWRCETCQFRKRLRPAQRLNLEPTDSSGRMFAPRQFDSPQTRHTRAVDAM